MGFEEILIFYLVKTAEVYLAPPTENQDVKFGDRSTHWIIYKS
jgi:hypothetical protein